MPSPWLAKPIDALAYIELTTKETPCGANTIVFAIEILFKRENLTMEISNSFSVLIILFL